MLPELYILVMTNLSPVLPPDLLERVRGCVQRGEEEETIELLSTFAARNPFHGDLWHLLGRYYEQIHDYSKAIEAYQQAIACGNRWSGAAEYQLARVLEGQGRSDEAAAWLERSLRLSLGALKDLESDSIWEQRRADARFTRIFTPRIPDTIERDEGWRIDLAYLAMRMEQAHYDLFGRETGLKEDLWRAAIEALDRRIPALEDHAIVVELMKIVALAGDGHTNLFPFGVAKGQIGAQKDLFHYAPLMFYLFEDGLFVRAAKAEYAEAVGARVLRIGTVTAEEALERVELLVFHDNAMQIKRQGPLLLSCPALVHALGISECKVAIELQLQRGQEAPFNVRLQRDGSVPPWFVWNAVEPGEWVSMRDAKQEKFLWLKNSDLYWFEYLEDRKMVYCQYNGVREKADESLAAFSERLYNFIESHDVQALVIDLRHNGGGDLTTHRPLLHTIIRSQKVNQRGRLFALIGRHTFSAAQHFTNQLDTHTEVTFVGECSGSRPQFVGEGNGFELPYSGLSVNASNLFWQSTYAMDRRMWIAPHIRAELSSQDYRTNRDPALDAVFAIYAK